MLAHENAHNHARHNKEPRSHVATLQPFVSSSALPSRNCCGGRKENRQGVVETLPKTLSLASIASVHHISPLLVEVDHGCRASFPGIENKARREIMRRRHRTHSLVGWLVD